MGFGSQLKRFDAGTVDKISSLFYRSWADQAGCGNRSEAMLSAAAIFCATE